jgi:acetate kinase
MAMGFILVINAGSSSLKFAVYDGVRRLVVKGQISGIGSTPLFEVGETREPVAGVTTLLDAQAHVAAWLSAQGHDLSQFSGIGHRIVHGGTAYVAPTLVDDRVQADLQALRSLAPLHLPFGLSALADMRQRAPGVPNIACFDTAFHATQPDVATRLPLPRSYHERGYRRYGFHGLNYEHVVKALPQQTGRALPARLLVAHLGNGASMCAIHKGASVATTMGFSTADGLVMGTRTGSIDPGVLIALMRDDHLNAEGLEDLLYRRSGLLGLSGVSSDMRVLLASPDPHAREAIDYYCYHAARYAGSLITTLGGVDAIAFTGGIGENAGPVRQGILSHLSWLNLSPSQIHVVKADEEGTIAAHVSALIGQ